MYNLSGIYYQIKSNCAIYLIFGIIFLILSKFWTVTEKNVKQLIGGIICILLAIGSIVYYGNVIMHPKISSHDGYFCSEHRVNTRILKMEYSFSNPQGRKPVFYLDVLSKKDIYPHDFQTNIKYRIFYETETNIIVKVEVID